MFDGALILVVGGEKSEVVRGEGTELETCGGELRSSVVSSREVNAVVSS